MVRAAENRGVAPWFGRFGTSRDSRQTRRIEAVRHRASESGLDALARQVEHHVAVYPDESGLA